jgi:hypothetical protein
MDLAPIYLPLLT